MGTEAGTIPIEWDELSPQEQDYYQNPPFSTHSDFLGAKGGQVIGKPGGLVEPGVTHYGEAPKLEHFDGIMKRTYKSGVVSYYTKVKKGDKVISFSNRNLNKVKVWKKKHSKEAKRLGYEKMDRTPIREALIEAGIKTSKIQAKARKNVDTWTKNWLNKNLKNYDVRGLKDFKKDLVKDWAKELKTNSNLYKGKTDFNPIASLSRTIKTEGLPNLTGASISDKPFKYGARTVGDKLVLESSLNKIFYDHQLKNKGFKNKVKNYMQHYVDGAPHGNNPLRKVYDSKTAKLLNDDVLYFLSKTDSGLDGASRQAVMEHNFSKLWRPYRNKIDKMSLNYQKTSKLIDEFLGGKNILSKASAAEHARLAKIFDVSELDSALRYNMDHMYGISEAAREINSANPSKARVRAILKNTLGMTQKRNFDLGTKWYSGQRTMRIDKIEKGIDVEANLKKLNKLTKKAYNVDDAYQITRGKVRPTKAFVGQTQPERFASFFKEIYKTKQGAAVIKKRHGSLKNLLQKVRNTPKGPGRLKIIGVLLAAGATFELLNEHGISSAEAAEAQTLETGDKTQEDSVMGNVAKGLTYGTLGTIAANYPQEIWEGGKKALKWTGKKLLPIMAPGVSHGFKLLQGEPYQPTSGHDMTTMAFWKSVIKAMGKTSRWRNKKISLAKRIKDLAWRGLIPTRFLPYISGGASLAAGPMLIKDAAEWLQKNIDEQGLTGKIEEQSFIGDEAGAGYLMSEAHDKKRREKGDLRRAKYFMNKDSEYYVPFPTSRPKEEDVMKGSVIDKDDLATGGIASLLKW
jgi:hypothetical protein